MREGEEMKTFAIITVCLNAENEIGKTLESVLGQSNTNYEYLVKDGGSKDRTLSIAQSYAPAFAEKGIEYRIISQADTGIYDAMNQAVQMVQGEWAVFMNAGDTFASSEVLSLVEQSGTLEDADVVYGNWIDGYGKWYQYKKSFPIEKMVDRIPFCHQSAFTRRQLFDHALYSLEYRLASDYLFYLERYLEGKKFKYYPLAVSVFDRYGASSNGMALAQERISIHEKMKVTSHENLQEIKNQIKRYRRDQFIYQHFSKYIPKCIRQKRRKIHKDKMFLAAGGKTKEEMLEMIRVETEKQTTLQKTCCEDD